MPEGVGRLEVGEVRHGRERRVELLVRQDDLEIGLRCDHGVPRRRRLDVAEQLRRIPAEGVHDRRVELRAAPLAGDRGGGRNTARPMEDLDDVGKAHEPRGDGDVLSADLAGGALAVPALEGLSQAVPHVLAQSELRRELFGGRSMVVQDVLDVAPAVAEEGDTEPRAVQERTSRAEVLQHEPRPGVVDEREVGFERQIVPEPLRLLVRVDVAAHPCEERGVVDRHALRFVQPDALTQAHRDQALAEDVLHGLPQPEVGAQRQDGEKLRTAHVPP